MKQAYILFLICISTFSCWSQDCRKASIYFNSNKYEAKRESLRVVDSVLNALHPDTLYLIEVHGHTDDRGSSEENRILAQERIDFVSEHLRESGKFSKIRLLYRNFGEENPSSEENKLNRRVDVFVIPIHPDGSVKIEEPSGVQVNIDYTYFKGCGYCLSDVQLDTQEEIGVKAEKLTYIRLLNNCDTMRVESCYSAEFRFPYEQFNTPSKIKVPKMIWINRCEDSDTLIRDSILIDSSYSAGFTTRFDHTTNEYVVTHKCFNPVPDFFICEKSIQCSDSLRLHLTDTIINKRSAYHYTYYDYPSKTVKDSTFRLPDTNFVIRNLCPEIDHDIIGLGFKNGELLFVNKKIENTKRIPIFDENGFFLYFERHIYEDDYKPLEYLESKIRVKIPAKIDSGEVGFYMEALDYFIPMEQMREHVFIYKNLNFPYSFGIKQGDRITSIDYKVAKKKYKRRSKTLKVKIRPKDLYSK